MTTPIIWQDGDRVLTSDDIQIPDGHWLVPAHDTPLICGKRYPLFERNEDRFFGPDSARNLLAALPIRKRVAGIDICLDDEWLPIVRSTFIDHYPFGRDGSNMQDMETDDIREYWMGLVLFGARTHITSSPERKLFCVICCISDG